MTNPLTIGLIILSLVLAVISLLTTGRNRPMGRFLLSGLGVIELGLLVQSGLAIAGLVRGEGPGEKAVFLGYLIGILLLPPVAAFLGLGERSRWGPAGVAVACFAIPAMLGRMIQLWSGVA